LYKYEGGNDESDWKKAVLLVKDNIELAELKRLANGKTVLLV
jgi:hypothetical protein